MNRLFDDRERNDLRPSKHSEDSFAYLNRSARPSSAHIRELLEEWYARYPVSERNELNKRFRADFHAAFFELFLYELLRKTGYCITLHPSLPGTRKRPDFLVEGFDVQFYLEAKVVRDQSAADETQGRIVGAVFDAINEIEMPHHFLHIKRLKVITPEQPSSREIKAFIYEKLASLACSDSNTSVDPLEEHRETLIRYRGKTAHLDFVLVPRSPQDRGYSGVRPIGVYPVQSKFIRTKDALRAAIKQKARKYGYIELPYMIAVNCISQWGLDEEDAVDALFGSEQVTIDLDSGEHQLTRARDGVWRGPSGPVNTRVSAILVVDVYPWSIAETNGTVFHNPWAAQPLNHFLHPFRSATVGGGRLNIEEGRNPLEIFGLSSGWPQV